MILSHIYNTPRLRTAPLAAVGACRAAWAAVAEVVGVDCGTAAHPAARCGLTTVRFAQEIRSSPQKSAVACGVQTARPLLMHAVAAQRLHDAFDAHVRVQHIWSELNESVGTLYNSKILPMIMYTYCLPALAHRSLCHHCLATWIHTMQHHAAHQAALSEPLPPPPFWRAVVDTRSVATCTS